MNDNLVTKLKAYVNSGFYPFHMPGHKRNMPEFIKNILSDKISFDLTELEYTDDLHNPCGIIKEAMDYAKKVYKTKKTYFIVNGSSCAIHSSLRLFANSNKKILLAKNSHISAYNAVELNKLNPIYLDLKKDEKYDIYLGIDIKKLKYYLDTEDISALYLVSPSYEGIISDIKSIASLCKEKNVILIVDEAHGAHLPFIDKKKSALNMGADIVIQSLHKTLPCLTQTALLHINSDKINLDEIEKNIKIFETSSPSYIFMASIDACIRYTYEMAQKEIKEYKQNIKEFRRYKYKNFELFNIKKDSADIKYLDDTKLVICIKNNIMDARLLAKILRDKYKLEMEMSNKNYILAYTSYCDTKVAFDNLRSALSQIDKEITLNKDFIKKLDLNKNIKDKAVKEIEKKLKQYINKKIENKIYIYPPGIPILKPGDILDIKNYDELIDYANKGYKIILA